MRATSIRSRSFRRCRPPVSGRCSFSRPAASIYQACLLRFRPIMMTTMAALLGGLPLMLGTGTGSEIRRPLGFAIVGGLIVSQYLTLYTTPVVYLYLDRLNTWLSGAQVKQPSRAQALLTK